MGKEKTHKSNGSRNGLPHLLHVQVDATKASMILYSRMPLLDDLEKNDTFEAQN